MTARWPVPWNVAEAARGEARQAWLTSLPVLVGQAADLWSLTVGAPFQPGGSTAWVAPARDAAGGRARGRGPAGLGRARRHPAACRARLRRRPGAARRALPAGCRAVRAAR